MKSNQMVGKWGERLAANYLEQRGYEILEVNYRTHYGEIDLVAQQGDVLVFVEVKSRRGTTLGMPEISVTPKKRAHLLAAIQVYFLVHPELHGNCRVDVIAIRRLGQDQPPEIVHFENAFD